MLLGLDCGSTAIKAVLFDRDGRAVATGSRRTDPRQPAPHRVEHDMDGLWALAAGAIRDALAEAPAGGVDAVGVTGHGDGLYLLDRAGRPLGPGIQSVDSRAQAVTSAWEASGLLARVAPIAGQRPYPYAASSLLAWIARQEPERFAAIGRVLFCKDWLRFRLTGVAATDPTDASTAFTDARSQRYSRELLSLLGIEAIEAALPLILPSSGALGTVTAEAAAATGLAAGTPVTGGMHDVTASAVGLGNLEPGVPVDHGPARSRINEIAVGRARGRPALDRTRRAQAGPVDEHGDLAPPPRTPLTGSCGRPMAQKARLRIARRPVAVGTSSKADRRRGRRLRMPRCSTPSSTARRTTMPAKRRLSRPALLA